MAGKSPPKRQPESAAASGPILVSAGGIIEHPSQAGGVAPVYGAAWSKTFVQERDKDNNPRLYAYLATCSGKLLHLYRSERRLKQQEASGAPLVVGSGPLELVRVFENQATLNEDHYCCTFAGRSASLETCKKWKASKRRTLRTKDVVEMVSARQRRQRHHSAVENDSLPLLCAAGAAGPIVVVDLTTCALVCTLNQHGDQVLDLKTHTVNEHILISCSMDQSIRLWDLQSFTCVAILGGGPHISHRDGIVSIDTHCSGDWIVSGGMDRTVKVWNIGPTTTIGKRLADIASKPKHSLVAPTSSNSYHEPPPPPAWDAEVDNRYMPQQHVLKQPRRTRGSGGESIVRIVQPLREPFPVFTTNHVHMHVVDCVHFMGNWILSKSTDSCIELWKPGGVNWSQQQEDSKASLVSMRIEAHLRSFTFADSNHWYSTFALDRNGRFLVVGNAKGELFVWNVRHQCCERQVYTLPKPHALIRRVAFSWDSNVLVVTTDQGGVFMWDLLADPPDASNVILEDATKPIEETKKERRT